MRVKGWEIILADQLRKHLRIPFYWGESDCIYWTAEVMEALADKNPVKEYLDEMGLVAPPYNNTRKMHKTVKALGFDSFREMITIIFDLKLARIENILLANRGDLVSFKIGQPMNDYLLGINTGSGVMFKTLSGVIIKNLSDCELAWRVE